jgi:hypothetical protein
MVVAMSNVGAALVPPNFTEPTEISVFVESFKTAEGEKVNVCPATAATVAGPFAGLRVTTALVVATTVAGESPLPQAESNRPLPRVKQAKVSLFSFMVISLLIKN